MIHLSYDKTCLSWWELSSLGWQSTDPKATVIRSRHPLEILARWICQPHQLSLYFPTAPHVQRGDRCVWLRMLGVEDGWGRKHKLQAGLLLLALSQLQKALSYLLWSTPQQSGWNPSCLWIVRQTAVRTVAHEYYCYTDARVIASTPLSRGNLSLSSIARRLNTFLGKMVVISSGSRSSSCGVR